MTARLRIVAYQVLPQLLADDGQTLTPLNVAPVTIPAAEWPGVLGIVAAGIEQLRQQVESPTPIPTGEVT